jgi:O-acetyl-ADP-ribose deacetylase (regulator of RNase III)
MINGRTNKIKTLTFPASSTGIYGFPLEHAAKIAIKEVKDFLKRINLCKK